METPNQANDKMDLYELEKSMTKEISLNIIERVIGFYEKYKIDKNLLVNNLLEKVNKETYQELNPLSVNFYLYFKAYNFHKRNKNEVMKNFFDHCIMEAHLEYLEHPDKYVLSKKDKLFIENIFEDIHDYE